MTINDIDALYAAIVEHLKYLDTAADDCTKTAKWSPPLRAERMQAAASTYAEVAAELRNALALETLTESKTQA